MHVIRLRHPWQREWYAESQLPSATLEPAAPQAHPLAQYQRSFNRPSGLLPEQAVWLVVEPLAPPSSLAGASAKSTQLLAIASLALNACPLVVTTENNRLQIRIEAALEPFNRLEILCHLSELSESPPELSELMEVRLEIA